MDSQTPDIYVIVYPAYVPCNADETDCDPIYDSDGDTIPDSNIPPPSMYGSDSITSVFDPLALVNIDIDNNIGLGVTPHQLVAIGATTRTIGLTQNAVMVFEDLTPRGLEEKGNSTIGTPNGLGLANIFTEFIKNSIQTDCAFAKTNNDCIDGESGLVQPDLMYRHFQDTFAHEIGHLMALLFKDPAFKKFKVEDNHLTIHGYMMETEPNVVINARKGTVEYQIPVDWSAISKGTLILNQ